MEFFRAGATYRERCAMCANRVGKTVGMGGYEMTCHLTGKYPEWWEGRRFTRHISAWMAGRTNETTRDILQAKMLGPVIWHGNNRSIAGTGLIPGDLLGDIAWKQGVPNLIDTIKVKHVDGGWSNLGVKTYQQGAGSFEGTEQHVIWLDEEPPLDVYGECVIRTAATGHFPGGLIMLTYTPKQGLSRVTLKFMPEEWRPADYEDDQAA